MVLAFARGNVCPFLLIVYNHRALFNCFLLFDLQDPPSDWQKVDYLLEFGEWLFVNEFPVDDAIDQVWIEILLVFFLFEVPTQV